MHNVVKEVFAIVIAVTIAAMLYFILFGSWDDNGLLTTNEFNYADGTASVGTQGGAKNQWQGVLWYSARVVENPIAFYYYNYCLTPNVHKNDYLDMELGCTVYGKTTQNGVTVNDYRGQSGSIVTTTADEYTTYPSNYSAGGVPTGIPDFESSHYYYRDIYSDF